VRAWGGAATVAGLQQSVDSGVTSTGAVGEPVPGRPRRPGRVFGRDGLRLGFRDLTNRRGEGAQWAQQRQQGPGSSGTWRWIASATAQCGWRATAWWATPTACRSTAIRHPLGRTAPARGGL